MTKNIIPLLLFSLSETDEKEEEEKEEEEEEEERKEQRRLERVQFLSLRSASPAIAILTQKNAYLGLCSQKPVFLYSTKRSRRSLL